MDSARMSSSINSETSLQIANIYCLPTRCSALEIQALPIQQQRGTKDCGVFSIAFAVEVCAGNNPEEVYFEQSEMRSHLFNCLECSELKPFPQKSRKALINRQLEIFYVKVFCSCRMPEQYDSDMVECVQCETWYHFKCVGIPKDTTVPDDWMCDDCK